MYSSFTLKISIIIPSLTEKEDFQQMWASNLLICLFCYNPAISVPRISKLVIRCIAALTLLKLQESYKTLKSVFCIANEPLIS